MSVVFVVSGPSGVGKSTILHRVLEAEPGLRFSVSHTTRAIRPGEVDGQAYHFVDRARFAKLAANSQFLEHAEYQGNLYGTSRSEVEKAVREGYDLILEVEIQGAEQLHRVLPDAIRVFIMPPSVDELAARLQKRQTETDDVMKKRLERAREEMDYAEQCDYRIVNESVDKAVDELRRVIREERAKAS